MATSIAAFTRGTVPVSMRTALATFRVPERLTALRRIAAGGSAVPVTLTKAFRNEYDVAVQHGWGMTELSPLGTANSPKPAQVGLSPSEAARHMRKQGRAAAGIDMKIVGANGETLPWDGKAFGELKVRGAR